MFKKTIKEARFPWLPMLLAGLLVAVLTGCAANPVTGRNELRFISEGRELQIGQQMYTPLQQQQGGEYIVDAELVTYVKGVANRLADVSDRALPYEFVVLNNSAVNAWALPGGKIAINRGLLLEMDTEGQLAAVIGHEIVHSAARHSARQMEKGMLLNLAMVGATLAADGHGDGEYAVLGAQLGSMMTTLKYGRNNELESDKYGMTYMSRAGYDPNEAVRVQEMFVRLKDGKTPGMFATLFSSHPPSQNRVDKNRETAGTLPAGGLVNRDVYQKKLAYLRGVNQAYLDQDAGRKALAKNDHATALRLANKAINVEPREAQFFELKGKALMAAGRKKEAESSFDKAISLNPKMYDSSLQRGTLRKERNALAGARADLETSVKLVGTSQGHYLLGMLEAGASRPTAALRHLEVAASGQGSYGESAQAEVARRTVSQRPERYIQTRVALDSRGYVMLNVQNKSSIPLRGVAGTLVAVDRNGNSLGKVLSWHVEGVLSSGGQVRIQTGVGPIGADSAVADVRVSVTRARPN